MRSRRPLGEYHAGKPSRNRARVSALLLLLAMGLGTSGCSLTMHLTSLHGDDEHTASTSKPISPLSPNMDEEDWRRAQSALSLAVDPQGSGQPVNWDNPSSKRRGVFAPSGQVVLTEQTVCREFSAILIEQGAPETRHEGKACRQGPGEWAIRDIRRAGATTTASTGQRPDAALTLQPLPAKSEPMILSGQRH
jgi:17 kDa outer membrane surface antigen